MNCRDALRLLYDVVDKEASDIDAAEVQKHLVNCRHCMAKYEMEQMFKTFVVEKGQNAPDTTQLKSLISQKLDDIDAAGEVGISPFPFRWLAVGLASAAAVALCVLATFALHDFYHQQAHILPFVNAHHAHTDADKQAFDRSDPFAYLYQQTGIRLELPAELSPDDIQSISIDTVGGVPFGHIEVVGDDNTTISLFVASEDAFTIPIDPNRMVNGSKMLVHCCDQWHLVGCKNHGMVMMAVSSPRHQPEELARLASLF